MAEIKQCWEYKRINTSGSSSELMPKLNTLGNEGWEVCAVLYNGNGCTFILKRPK